MNDCCPEAFDNGGAGDGGGGGESPIIVPAALPTTVVTAALETLVALTIPAGLLANDGDVLELELGGDMLQNNGAAQNWALGLRLDATVLWFDATATYVLSGNRRSWNLKATIRRVSAVLCTLTGQWLSATTGNGTTTGVGDISTAPQGNAFSSGPVDPAANWAASQQLEMRVQASAAGGSDITCRVAWAKPHAVI